MQVPSLILLGETATRYLIDTDPLDKLPVAHEAEFDSYKDQHEEECLPGTRTELLSKIQEWAISPEGKCMFWLSGVAGTGKSTICRTVARRLKQDRLLAATFFFKRGEGDRGNATKFFTTVSRRIAKSTPELRLLIQNALSEDTDIATRSLKHQFDTLLLQPIQELRKSNSHIPTRVIVIDALDECDPDDDIQVILQLLPQLREALSLRIFLTSRPELPIRLGFSEMSDDAYQNLVLHQIPETVIAHDITLFLDHRLLKIRKNQSLPNDWPGSTNIQALVALSVPLFIFIATLCRMFEDPHWDPVDSLDEVLGYKRDGSQLEATYLPILNRLLKGQRKRQESRLVEEYQRILGTIVILERPLSITTLSKLGDLPERLIGLRLKLLHSILNVPEDTSLPVRLFHLSFRDFLLDPETKATNPFWVDEKENKNQEIIDFLHDAKRFLLKFRQIADEAPLQIYSSGLLFTPRKAIIRKYFKEELPSWVLRPPDVEEAWSEDLQSLEGHSFGVQVVSFCSKGRILASGSFDKTIRLWDTRTGALQQTLRGHSDGVSSLVFYPDNNGRFLVSGSYDKTVRLWDTVTGEMKWCHNDHSDGVTAVAVYPNSRLFASTSFDRTVMLRDMTTGAILQPPLTGHSRSIFCLAFSADGKLLASGSRDKTIRLWDSTSGAWQRTLLGHSDLVYSVAFSPQGLLASGSEDRTARLWDPATGALLQCFASRIELDAVYGVTFSPDGRLLVTGSGDRTVKVRDTAMGTLKHTFKSHSALARSVAFSPDGHTLASGSLDHTVRLWDLSTHSSQQSDDGHSDWVWTIVFSPDKQILASASWDHTVKLWDPISGHLQRTLKGHSDAVLAIAFTSDGQYLASGSRDESIKIWDITTGSLQLTLIGHMDPIYCVTFAPISRLLASGSSDDTVKIWDATTGALLQTLKGHSSSIHCVAFSPDGLLLASGSSDHTVKLWDIVTGTLRHTLEGHQDTLLSLTFSHNGQLLVTSSSGQTVKSWEVMSATLQHTYIMNGEVTGLEFSNNDSYLRTNLGLLYLQSLDDPNTQISHLASEGISILEDTWIAICGEAVLWLPPEYRSVCSAIHGNKVVLGHASGRISFLGLSCYIDQEASGR
ncbi:uncharacterized protein N7496_006879 [Penicillium cataractarum]|uniref:Mitochondrial division protein 1 n=1 Tax=Penicillium cataractarum TaxID=2100454 RepID=A0A9W9S336_9EURO|nr:uncharacterized protein N7496_006879 [Penicillium cataractarum]KAJ5370787.1 hypothetical protein N7496_006879 [Penicillium cataractarum]